MRSRSPTTGNSGQSTDMGRRVLPPECRDSGAFRSRDLPAPKCIPLVPKRFFQDFALSMELFVGGSRDVEPFLSGNRIQSVCRTTSIPANRFPGHINDNGRSAIR